MSEMPMEIVINPAQIEGEKYGQLPLRVFVDTQEHYGEYKLHIEVVSNDTVRITYEYTHDSKDILLQHTITNRLPNSIEENVEEIKGKLKELRAVEINPQEIIQFARGGLSLNE